MIAEIFPELYDIQGGRVFAPGTRARRVGFRPTAHMERYVAQPLNTQCKDFTEMRRFLSACRGREMAHARRLDYWQPPEQFEARKTGDCVDFALWAWRQVLAMGYPARFVGGKHGKLGEGHAWVMFEKNGKHYLLEPQYWLLGLKMPRLSALRYHPKFSVAWDGHKLQYFEHEDRNTDPLFRYLPGLVGEWLWLWTRYWIWFAYKLPIAMITRLIGESRRN